MPFIAIVFARDAAAANKLRRVVDPDGYDDNGGYKIIGLFQMPRNSDPTCGGFCGEFGWGRNRELGHMQHSCGRRGRGWRKAFQGWMFDTFGKNRLPRNQTPTFLQNPEGWD
jgi:hypothetical protein